MNEYLIAIMIPKKSRGFSYKYKAKTIGEAREWAKKLNIGKNEVIIMELEKETAPCK